MNKRYPSYKPSGVEWIGEIPHPWNRVSLKRIASTILGKMLTSEDKGNLHKRYYLRAQNIQWLKTDISDVKEMWFTSDELTKLRLKKGDLLVSEGGEVGRTCMWNEELKECYIQNSVHIVRTVDLNVPRYYLYYFVAAGAVGYFDALVNRISIAHLTGEKLKEVQVLVPSVAEQQAIAAYLDRKTALIDAAIQKKQRLIELFREERTALINQAVTRGLNPDVKLKPSGVEWLGDVPEHWEVKKLKFVIQGKLEYGANESAEQENRHHPRYIRITDFGDDGKLRPDTFKSLAPEVAEDYLLEDGDVLFARSGATVGKTFQFKNYEGVACFAGYLIRARPNQEVILSDMLYYFTRSGSYNNWKNSIFNQATIQNIGADKYSTLEIPVPSVNEQKTICKHISEVEFRVEMTTKTISTEISLLQEYRTTLINEVVTGKRCVLEEKQAPSTFKTRKHALSQVN